MSHRYRHYTAQAKWYRTFASWEKNEGEKKSATMATTDRRTGKKQFQITKTEAVAARGGGLLYLTHIRRGKGEMSWKDFPIFAQFSAASCCYCLLCRPNRYGTYNEFLCKFVLSFAEQATVPGKSITPILANRTTTIETFSVMYCEWLRCRQCNSHC